MSEQSSKRVTLDLQTAQHKKLKSAAKLFGLTQQDTLSLIVDLTLTNPDNIKEHAARFRRKREAEEARQRDMEKKAQTLLSKLSDEQQMALLSGELDLSPLL